MKDIMSEFEFYALYTCKRELCYLAQILCLSGELNLVVIENSLMSSFAGSERKCIKQRKLPSPIRDFMNERFLKLSDILNLNLLKFNCQNLPLSGSLASSKLNPFLFPQELKFNLKTISKAMPRLGVILHVRVLGRKGECKRDVA